MKGYLEYLYPITRLFANVNTPEINQNALIAKISTCKKDSKFPNQERNKQFGT